MIQRRIIFFYTGLYITLYFAGTEAAGADADRGDTAVSKLMADVLKVGIKTTLRLMMGMADVVADFRTLAAESALFAHGFPPVYLSR